MALSRAQMEEVINRGGSVLVNGKVAFRLDQLPSMAALAKTPAEKEAVTKSLDEQIAELQAQKAQISSDQSADFTPLPQEELQKKIEAGVFTSDVTQSIAFYMKKDSDARKAFAKNDDKESDESKDSAPTDTTDQYPEDFPSRAVFGKSGKSFDEVKTLTREQLLEIAGIGPATAEAVLAYQK